MTDTTPPQAFSYLNAPVNRRRWLRWSLSTGLAGLVGTSVGLTARAAKAQVVASHWPQRALQLIVPWPAGSATDLTLRVLCEEVEPHLGQRIIVSNRPGAAGSLVAPALKAAEPDGYTIGQVPLTVYRHALMNHVP